MAIDSVLVQAVRGIRTPVQLVLSGSSLLVRGDNGTGKSSIVHALMWALRGERAVWDEQRAGGDAWHHVLEEPGKALVQLELSNGGSIRITTDGVQANAEGSRFRRACERANPFLPRRQLLEFLEQRPVDRFQYLQSFLDLECVDATQAALAERISKHQSAANATRAECDRLIGGVLRDAPIQQAQLPSSWEELTAILQQWASQVGVNVATWGDLLDRVDELQDGTNLSDTCQTRNRLNAAHSNLQHWQGEAWPDDPEPEWVRLRELERDATDGKVLSLLEEAAAYLSTTAGTSTCPVCEQRVVQSELATSLGQRIAALNAICDLRKSLQTIAQEWRTRMGEFQRCRRSSCEALAAASEKVSPLETLGLGDANASWEDVIHNLVQASPSAVIQSCNAAGSAMSQALRTALERLPAIDVNQGRRALAQAVKRASDSELAIRLAVDRHETASSIADTLRLVSESLRKSKQDVAQEVLKEIGGLAKEFYDLVHIEDDGVDVTGAPEIVIQRRGQGTALVRGRFNAKPIDDPRLFYSDGHLDTVGICIFLALRRFRADRDKKSDPRLMVLDDIVLSIDLGHARRLLKVINDRFADHQVLIFTHNGLFFDWCKQELPKYRARIIKRWSLEAGPQLGDYASALQYLHTAIADESSAKRLAQTVMNLMDEWLAEVRFVHELSIPARPGEQYTLTEIWSQFGANFKSALKKWTPLESELEKVLELIDELKGLPHMRNRLAAHENDFAREFPLGVVRTTGEQCIKLVAALYCAGCGRFAELQPDRREPSTMMCRCEKLRYIRPRKQQAMPASE